MFPLFFMMGGVQSIILTVSADQTNYDAFVQAGSPTSIVNLTVIVNAGVTLKGGSALQALDLTGFPTGTTYDIQVSGKIKGRGGRGGSSGIAESDPSGGICGSSSRNGQAGGHAILGDAAITLTVNAGGEVRGGSGGGGAGRGQGDTNSSASGGGGGGGRGLDGGAKGTAGSSSGSPGADGAAGSDSAGGTGGSGGSQGDSVAGPGGQGGNTWAVAGTAGGAGSGPTSGSCPGTAGNAGAAGKAVSLSAGSTTLVNNGTVDGVVD